MIFSLSAPATRRAFLLIAAAITMTLLSCSNGENALYNPEKSLPLQITLRLLNSPNDTVPLADSAGHYRVFSPCTLKLSPETSSLNLHGEKEIWSSEEIAVALNSHYQWWIANFYQQKIDTMPPKFGYAPLLNCSDIGDSVRAHFILIDVKGDMLRDSLTIVAIDTTAK